ncbi:MAG: toll/interleukin-1 receptor domain-containing protein [Rhodoglobus sp.]
MSTTPGYVDPLDPVFISYRQKDGTDHVIELAWLLRAAGIPVWRDRDDLPPGDTDNRLAEAIDAGISGAVLVITPDIGASRIVKTVEAPKIISLHVADPVFALAIVNAIRKPDGHLDYAAPDRLLGRDPQILQGVDQKDSSRVGILAVVRLNRPGFSGGRVLPEPAGSGS